MPLCAKVTEEVDQKLDARRKVRAPQCLAPQDGTSGERPRGLLLTGPPELTAKLEHNLSGMLGGSDEGTNQCSRFS